MIRSEELTTLLTAHGDFRDPGVEKLPSAKANVTTNDCSRQIDMITDSWGGRDKTPRILVRISKDTQFDMINKWQ